jgi:multidrug resistance efflux pump
VTNTVLAPGQFASAGRTVATIIDSESSWVVANMPENALGNIRAGDRVLITFNVRPGQIYGGRVQSVAAGIAHHLGGTGELARVMQRRKWIRDTQRFPLRIELADPNDVPALRVGSGASVVVITERAGPIGWLAAAWLRIVATANYAF